MNYKRSDILVLLVCMSAPHTQTRTYRYCLSCMLVWCLNLNYWKAESVTLSGPWSLERRHGACMSFKMSVVKETSISVSYEHLIQDCTTGWYEYNYHMHAKHRYIILAFWHFFPTTHKGEEWHQNLQKTEMHTNARLSFSFKQY